MTDWSFDSNTQAL